MRNLVEIYRNTVMARKHLLPKPLIHNIVPEPEQSWFIKQFQKLGTLEQLTFIRILCISKLRVTGVIMNLLSLII